jgi:UDP-N-acetylmuramyl pentapeptide synthase
MVGTTGAREGTNILSLRSCNVKTEVLRIMKPFRPVVGVITNISEDHPASVFRKEILM